MPKCKVCNSCLDVYSEGEAVFYHCFLCNKLYDLTSRKDIDMFKTAYIVTHNGNEFLIAGGLYSSEEEVIRTLKDVFPESEFTVKELKLHISMKTMIREIIELL